MAPYLSLISYALSSDFSFSKMAGASVRNLPFWGHARRLQGKLLQCYCLSQTMQPALCLGIPFEHCDYLEWVERVEVVGVSLLMVHEAPP